TGAAATAAGPSLAKVSLGATRGSVRLPESAANGARPVRLSRNENAYGPSANVTATMRRAAFNEANRYPEVEAEALRIRIAAQHAIAPEQIILGGGGSEIMRMAVDAFLRTHKKIVTALPNFGLISDFAQRACAEVVPVR